MDILSTYNVGAASHRLWLPGHEHASDILAMYHLPDRLLWLL